MEINAKDFWARIDDINPYKSLAKLSEISKLSYDNIKKQRYFQRIPGSLELYLLSLSLNKSMEFLLTGEDKDIYPQNVKRIADTLMYRATSEDYKLVERILRIPPPKEEEKEVENA